MKLSESNARTLMHAASSLTARSRHSHALVDVSLLPGSGTEVSPVAFDTSIPE